MIGDIDDSFIQEAAHGRPRTAKAPWGLMAAAACLCLVIASVVFLHNAGLLPGAQIDGTDPTAATTAPLEAGDTVQTPVSKENVDAFMTAFDAIGDGEPAGGCTEEGCFNVTPPELESATGAQIFKFAENGQSYLYFQGKAYSLGDFIGGLGYLWAVPWDYDENGTKDILYSASWGSGVYGMSIYLFDLTTMETQQIVGTIDPSVGLLFPANAGDEIAVYTADSSSDFSFVDMTFTGFEKVGCIRAEEGVPRFTAEEGVPDAYFSTLP